MNFGSPPPARSGSTFETAVLSRRAKRWPVIRFGLPAPPRRRPAARPSDASPAPDPAAAPPFARERHAARSVNLRIRRWNGLDFVGLGTMGAAMAGHLVRSGGLVTVWNRSPGRAAELVDLGATEVGRPARRGVGQRRGRGVRVRHARRRGGPVRARRAGRAGPRPGSLVIDCSTIAPGATRDMAGQAGRAGRRLRRRARVGRLRGRPEGDPDDLRRRRAGRLRTRPADPRGDGQDDHPRRSGRQRPGDRRPSTR